MKSDLVRWFIEQFLSSEAKKLAEGERGKRAQSWYWWLAGRKRYTGFALGLVAYAMAATATALGCGGQGTMPGCENIVFLAKGLATVAGALVMVGFVDQDFRRKPQTLPKALAGVAAQAATLGLVLELLSQALGVAAAHGYMVAHAEVLQQLLEQIVLPSLVWAGLATTARVATHPARRGRG